MGTDKCVCGKIGDKEETKCYKANSTFCKKIIYSFPPAGTSFFSSGVADDVDDYVPLLPGAGSCAFSSPRSALSLPPLPFFL